MKVKIYQYKNHASIDESLTAQHFLKWQNINYEIIETIEMLKYTRGISYIHFAIHGKDDMPLVGFNSFHDLYEWVKNAGMIRI